MQQQVKADEPYYRGLFFLPLKKVNSPIIVRNTRGYEDGPCELAARELEMPPIEDLDEVTRYSLGVATRYIGFSFDQMRRTVSDAILMYGELSEAVDAHMQRYRAGQCGPFSVNDLADALLRKYAHLYQLHDVGIRAGVHGYVNYALNAQLEKGPPPRAFDLEKQCGALLGKVPAFHLPSNVYDQCERADWTAFTTDKPLLPAPAFLIAVDGETWLQFDSDPLIQAQTEWLLVDAREREWRLYERVKHRGMNIPADDRCVALHAAVRNYETGIFHPLESQTTYLPFGDSYTPYAASDDRQAGRLGHALYSFCLLLRHPRVSTQPHRVHGHWSIHLPEGSSVDELIADVLESGKQ